MQNEKFGCFRLKKRGKMHYVNEAAGKFGFWTLCGRYVGKRTFMPADIEEAEGDLCETCKKVEHLRRCEICGKQIYSKKYNYCRECITKSLANPAKLEQIKRACLKCDREFLAAGRFNRICPSCQNSNREINLVLRFANTVTYFDYLSRRNCSLSTKS